MEACHQGHTVCVISLQVIGGIAEMVKGLLCMSLSTRSARHSSAQCSGDSAKEQLSHRGAVSAQSKAKQRWHGDSCVCVLCVCVCCVCVTWWTSAPSAVHGEKCTHTHTDKHSTTPPSLTFDSLALRAWPLCLTLMYAWLKDVCVCVCVCACACVCACVCTQCRPDKERIKMLGRKGFVRIALEEQIDGIVPVYYL